MPPEGAAAPAAAGGDRPGRLRIADVALFYGERSGGIRTYLEAKARFAARTGAFEHHLVVPGRPASPRSVLDAAVGEPRGARDRRRGDRGFHPGFALWRCWRGPSWMNTAWLLVPAMRELGYEREAARVVSSMELAVDRHGYREYYNPLTGRGLAARGFGFSTLLIDLLAQCGIGSPSPSDAGRMIRP